jgi:hypothetical protein
MTRAAIDAPLPRSPEELFDLLCDVCNESRWHPDFRGATKLTDGPVGKGTVWDARYRGAGPDAGRDHRLRAPAQARLPRSRTGDRDGRRVPVLRRPRAARACSPRSAPASAGRRALRPRSWAPSSAASSPSAPTRSCAPSPRSPGRSPARPDQPRPARLARQAAPGALACVTVGAHRVGRQILRVACGPRQARSCGRGRPRVHRVCGERCRRPRPLERPGTDVRQR